MEDGRQGKCVRKMAVLRRSGDAAMKERPAEEDGQNAGWHGRREGRMQTPQQP